MTQPFTPQQIKALQVAASSLVRPDQPIPATGAPYVFNDNGPVADRQKLIAHENCFINSYQI